MTTSQPSRPQSLPEPPTAGRRLKILVVDADHRVRNSLAGLLSLGDALEVVGTAGQPAAAIDLCAEGQPDAIILDPRLPDTADGLDLIRALRRQSPRVRILVLSWDGGTEADAAALGVDGIVPKSISPHELVERISALDRRAGPRRRPV